MKSWIPMIFVVFMSLLLSFVICDEVMLGTALSRIINALLNKQSYDSTPERQLQQKQYHVLLQR